MRNRVTFAWTLLRLFWFSAWLLLFVHEFKQDRVLGSAAAYTFLGCANYVSHEGSRPMSITWALDRPIPAKYLKKTNKLVTG